MARAAALPLLFLALGGLGASTREQKVDGKNVVWWAHRARSNGHRMREAERMLHQRWTPTASYAIRLASRVFGLSEAKMRAVAWCESTMRPWASNGRYHGLFQLGWAPFGFSPYDPVANALSTAATVVHDGGWRQWSCG